MPYATNAADGFAVGAYAPERLLSLVLCGNQPYEWDPAWPFVPAITAALSVAETEGMQGFVESLESSFNDRITEPTRSRMLGNDPAAIRAAWESAMAEGPLPTELSGWQVPCLIYMPAADDMHDNVARAAAEIPHATLLSLPDATHLSAPDEVDQVLPHVRTLLRSPAVS